MQKRLQNNEPASISWIRRALNPFRYSVNT